MVLGSFVLRLWAVHWQIYLQISGSQYFHVILRATGGRAIKMLLESCLDEVKRIVQDR